MSLLVHETGPLLLVQDLGRAGSMHLGVPPSGALDRTALALANRLVGNPERAAGLEILVGGVRLRAQTSLRIALTGAVMGLRIGGRSASWGLGESVRSGEEVEVRSTDEGLRAWLAISGGVLASTCPRQPLDRHPDRTRARPPSSPVTCSSWDRGRRHR